MAARFWIGTSGWHYGHWRGAFYPEGLPTSRWLAHYVEHFPTVEINNSFYRQPKESAWRLWQRSAPDGFRFAVKANRYLTHLKRLADAKEPLDRFLDGARLLEDRLGPALYQLPPNFHRTPDNERRLADFLELLPKGMQHVFEFRHASWLCDDCLQLLRQCAAGFCVFDKPELECPLVATAPFAYVRFHGTEARYSGNYTDNVLAGWADRLRGLAKGLTDVYIYFNNDASGYAVNNAKTLAGMLA